MRLTRDYVEWPSPMRYQEGGLFWRFWNTFTLANGQRFRCFYLPLGFMVVVEIGHGC